MSSKKTNRNEISSSMEAQKRPKSFNDFGACVKWLKRSVYLIARGRKTIINGKEVINWITLGSGFIAAPKRMLTAAHVINDPEKGELMQHQVGDKYYLLRRDEDDNWHYSIFEPMLDREIFLYPDLDLGIIYLDDSFYSKGENIFANEDDDYIRISKDLSPLGSSIGVLGYPLCKLEFENQDHSKPKIGNVLLRADMGVINCRYRTAETVSLYEFTLAFNPGNSGGPIFDVITGKVISIVKGFKAIPIRLSEIRVTDETAKQFKEYTGKSYIETLHATYSIGFATPSFLKIFKDHNITN